jgi:hypothetical protein
LSAWEELFGRGAIRAGVYRPHELQILQQFCELAGLNLNLRLGDRVNPTLSPRLLPVLRLFDELVPGSPKRRRVAEALADASTFLPDSDDPMTPALRKEIEIAYKEDNLRFARSYLGPDDSAALLLDAPKASVLGLEELVSP